MCVCVCVCMCVCVRACNNGTIYEDKKYFILYELRIKRERQFVPISEI